MLRIAAYQNRCKTMPMVTSERIGTLEEAYEYAGYYMQRSEIERFQYVLKSECAIEKLQEGV